MNDFPTVDQLINLANTNPEALEQLRKKQVESLIESAPKHLQRRLRGLQFQIDCKREIHSDSPMGSCMEITQMMMNSLQKLNEALHGYTPQDTISDQQAQPTSVIPFPAAAN